MKTRLCEDEGGNLCLMLVEDGFPVCAYDVTYEPDGSGIRHLVLAPQGVDLDLRAWAISALTEHSASLRTVAWCDGTSVLVLLQACSRNALRYLGAFGA